MMAKKFFAVFAVLLIAGVGVWNWQKGEDHESIDTTTDKPVVKIGVIYPLSGNASFFGEGAKNAAKMFFDNFDHGKSNYKYELVWEDSQANSAKGVMAAKKLIDYDKVDVLIDCFSGVAAAISPIANENQIVHLSFAQDIKISKGFYNYRVVTSTQKTGMKMLQALTKKGYKNVLGVVENAGGTLSLFEGFISAIEDSKAIKMDNVVNINPGERDFNIIIQKINLLKPDVIVVALQSPEIDIFMKQIQNHSINIPIVGIQSFSFLKDKSLAEGKWYVDVAFTDKNFAEEYQKYTGSDVTNFAENFYTILQVITHVFESSKSNSSKPSSTDITKNLIYVNGLKSPIGILTVDTNLQNIDSEASIRQIKNGKIEEVEN